MLWCVHSFDICIDVDVASALTTCVFVVFVVI